MPSLINVIERANTGILSEIIEPNRFVTNLGTGILMNLLLLYAIRRFSGTSMGTYKYLLTCFTIADVFLATAHALMRPVSSFISTIQSQYNKTYLIQTKFTLFLARVASRKYARHLHRHIRPGQGMRSFEDFNLRMIVTCFRE